MTKSSLYLVVPGATIQRWLSVLAYQSTLPRLMSGQTLPVIQSGLNWRWPIRLACRTLEEALSSLLLTLLAAVFDAYATHNQAFHSSTTPASLTENAWSQMQSTYDELVEQQHVNETAAARVVGLVM